MRRTVGLVVAALFVVGACGGDDEGTVVTPPATPLAVATSTSTAAATSMPGGSADVEAVPETTAPHPATSPLVPCATEGAVVAPVLGPADPIVVPDDAVIVQPGQPLSEVLAGLVGQPDPVVVLAEGEYPVVTIRDSGPVTIVGASRDGTVVAGFVLDGARDVSVRRLTVAGNDDPASHGVLVTGGSARISLDDLTIDPLHNAGVEIVDRSSNVTVTHSLITGEHVSRKLGPARNVHVGEGTPDLGRWVSDIVIRGNELVGAGVDAIQVAGARNVTIAGNFIHDLQQNDDHNDGIQIVAVDGALIDGNTLTTMSAASQDQSILLGHLGGGAGPAADPNLRVRDVLVTNNLVHHWRGAGITLSGTIDVTVAHNTSMDNGRDGVPFPGLLIDATYAPNESLRVLANVVSDIVYESGATAAEQVGNVVAGGGAGPQDLAAEPCFANRSDYRLSPQSPAVDLGAIPAVPAADHDGRPRDARPDAGAVELR